MEAASSLYIFVIRYLCTFTQYFHCVSLFDFWIQRLTIKWRAREFYSSLSVALQHFARFYLLHVAKTNELFKLQKPQEVLHKRQEVTCHHYGFREGVNAPQFMSLLGLTAFVRSSSSAKPLPQMGFAIFGYGLTELLMCHYFRSV